MSHLLDVNFLVALFDARHVNHDAAHRWFGATGATDWATCPITETGCVRVLSNPAYPTVSASPHEALRRLARFCDSGGHRFWPGDVSLRDALDEGDGRSAAGPPPADRLPSCRARGAAAGTPGDVRRAAAKVARRDALGAGGPAGRMTGAGPPRASTSGSR